jgi:hypothetical protein
MEYYLANDRAIKCQCCESWLRFREEPNSRYLWSAAAQGNMPGAGGACLMRLPVYRTIN